MRFRAVAVGFAAVLACHDPAKGSGDASAPPAAPAAATTEADASTDAAPVSHAYDLAADLATRTEEARALFGPSTEVRTVASAYLVVNADHGALFGPGAELLRRVLEALLAGPFPSPPAQAVTVFLFSTHQGYVRFSKSRHGVEPEHEGILAYYWGSGREELVDATTGLSTGTHEAVHPLVEDYFGGKLPVWADEGVSSLFEHPRFDPDGTVHGATNWRLDGLRAAMQSRAFGDEMHIGRLFGMKAGVFLGKRKGEEPDHAAALRHYGLARYFFQWLDERGKAWDFLHAWHDGIGEDPDGVRSFEKVVGMSPSDADAAWRTWVLGLRR